MGGAGLHYTLCLFLDNELRSVFVFSPLVANRLVFWQGLADPRYLPEGETSAAATTEFFPPFRLTIEKALGLFFFSTQLHNEGEVVVVAAALAAAEVVVVVVVGVNVHIITLKRPAWR